MPRPSAARLAAAVLALCLATAAFVLAPPHTSAAALPAPTLSASVVQRGESFTVSGTGCWDPDYDPYGQEGRSGWFVHVMSGAFSGGMETDEWHEGNWSVTVDVGGHLGPGVFPVRASCSLGGSSGWLDYPTVSVTVVGEPLPPKPWETPYLGPPMSGPPAVQPAPPRTTPGGTPRITAPPSTATGSTPSATSSTSSGAATPSSAPGPVPAPGCTDCGKLTGGKPVTAGDELSLSYAGFQPGEQITLVMRSTPVELGTFTADAAGVVTAEFALPASAESGSHTLTFSGPVTGDHVVRFRLAATDDPAGEPVTAPASEGTDRTLPVLGGAALLLLAGGGVLLYRRRAARPDRPQEGGTPGQPTETPIAEPIA